MNELICLHLIDRLIAAAMKPVIRSSAFVKCSPNFLKLFLNLLNDFPTFQKHTGLLFCIQIFLPTSPDRTSAVRLMTANEAVFSCCCSRRLHCAQARRTYSSDFGNLLSAKQHLSHQFSVATGDHTSLTDTERILHCICITL